MSVARVLPATKGLKLISFDLLRAALSTVSSLLQEASAKAAAARINRFFFIITFVKLLINNFKHFLLHIDIDLNALPAVYGGHEA